MECNGRAVKLIREEGNVDREAIKEVEKMQPIEEKTMAAIEKQVELLNEDGAREAKTRLPVGKVYYKCNPNKAYECKKVYCKYNAKAEFPECDITSHREWAYEDAAGNPIKAKEQPNQKV